MWVEVEDTLWFHDSPPQSGSVRDGTSEQEWEWRIVDRRTDSERDFEWKADSTGTAFKESVIQIDSVALTSTSLK